MNLTKNFTLEELCKSDVALRYNITNIPMQDDISRLQLLAENILQPLRDKFGPFVVSSGYRSQRVNSLVGSNPLSQHTKGEAADFEIATMSNLNLATYISETMLFDQLILEYYDAKVGPNSGWVHCSYSGTKNRKELLTVTKVNGRVTTLLGFVTSVQST